VADIQWYYARDDEQHGPISSAELRQLASTGTIGPDDYVWREGMEEWAPAGRVKGLFPPHVTAAAENSPQPDMGAASPSAEAPPEQPLVPAAVDVISKPPKSAASLAAVLRLVQGILWGVCVVVILLGGILLAVTIVRTSDTQEEAAAGATFSALFVGSYILARAGEKISQLLLARDRHEM